MISGRFLTNWWPDSVGDHLTHHRSIVLCRSQSAVALTTTPLAIFGNKHHRLVRCPITCVCVCHPICVHLVLFTRLPKTALAYSLPIRPARVCDRAHRVQPNPTRSSSANGLGRVDSAPLDLTRPVTQQVFPAYFYPIFWPFFDNLRLFTLI